MTPASMAAMRSAGTRPRPQTYVEFYPGSGGPLDLSFYSNIGPGRDLDRRRAQL